MTHSYYPIALDLQGKPCLVVGGGTIATDKVEGLLHAEALVTVVSPEVTSRLACLAESGEIELRRREYEPGDLDGTYLAYGATDDRATNARVTQQARQAGILVNAVDDIPNCDFFAVAVVRRGDMQVAISTNGLSPAFARWTREYLEEALPAEFADLLTILGDVRLRLKAAGPVPDYHHWRSALTEDIFALLREGDVEAAHGQVLSSLRAAQERRAASLVSVGSAAR